MDSRQLNILLADDDIDDCIFFKDALKELHLLTHLITVSDGEELMDYLSGNSEQLPDVLFLDLNMPRKNGFECLVEIKENEKLKDLSIVMFSTSYPRDPVYEKDMIHRLLKIGAFHFIRKPEGFEQLKLAIHNSLKLVLENNSINGKRIYL